MSEDTKASTKHLTSLGGHGWELITVKGNGQFLFAFLKKEAEDQIAIKL